MKEAIKTTKTKFHKKTLGIIKTANDIIDEYDGAGITVRQLYYQFVVRDVIPNNQKAYTTLSAIINNARMDGLIDWDAIIDRTRASARNSHFDNPSDILYSAVVGYQVDSREDQDFYVEVWIEKEALLGVIEPVCRRLDVTYLACRGYLSQSAMYNAAQRMRHAESEGQETVVLYLGDHDPSGIDMTRDIQERLEAFGAETLVDRLGLNMDQVEHYNPPPNFAKLTDTRSAKYIDRHGRDSWELDALSPQIITMLVEDAIDIYTDDDKRQALLDQQEKDRDQLNYVMENWEEL